MAATNASSTAAAAMVRVNNGYVVIAPNYRGSTGHGKDFEERNRFDMGGGDLCDVVEAAAAASPSWVEAMAAT